MFELNFVRYKHILALGKHTFRTSEVTCVLGESASGKTTLLRLLNKMISPDEGTIFFNDRALEQIPSTQHRREVMMLSQSPVVFHSSLEDNLQCARVFSQQPRATRTELLRVLERTHLHANLDQSVHSFSGGEKQRMALARVMLADPEVYLLDEPSSSLDETTAFKVVESLVAHVRQKRKTLIMVTHDKKVARAFSDRIFLVEQGDLKEVIE